jgi:hypothetical protein
MLMSGHVAAIEPSKPVSGETSKASNSIIEIHFLIQGIDTSAAQEK